MKSRILSFILLSAFFAILGACTNSNKEISLTSLVNDMINRDLTSEFPNPEFTLKQYSSYDQNSLAPDQDGWFANHDASWFIRQEENDGRREFVMLDADGPGAIVRFWMTFGNKDAYTGTIRFYIDGSDIPVIEGPVLDIISGGALVGEPLSSSVSPETDYFKRGHNLYLPIPYGEHLKITYECQALNPERHSPSVYYNINYRTYTEGISVKSFSMEELEEIQNDLKLVQTKLQETGDSKVQTSSLRLHSQNGELLPGETRNLTIPGSNAIHKIELHIEAENLPQALRSTVLEIIFDGERTIWSPIGDFYGTGYQIRPYKTWYTEVDENGTLSCYWIMPFKKSAIVNLINYGDQTVNILKHKVFTDKYSWKRNSMHFGAIWKELREVETGGSSRVNGDDKHVDVNYVTLNGEGVYMGSGLTIFNTVDSWWGEGDEKIWVDGESFPSFIGTGTEDYFGYAWCRPEKFSHFLIAQPDGSGNFHPGMSVNLRFHILDGIPFKSSIQFDLELWHWTKAIINYAPMSYWYMKPGGTYNIEPDPEAVQKEVFLKMNDMIEPKLVEGGILEGENLRVTDVSNGNYQYQAINEWDWSNGAQLWWIASAEDATLIAEFIMPEAGEYQVRMIYTKAIDYGNFKIAVNDKFSSKTFVGFHDQTGKDVITDSSNIGIFTLAEGINTITLKTVGTHPKAIASYMVGIDLLQFSKVK